MTQVMIMARHGEAQNNTLTTYGEAQMRALGQRIRSLYTGHTCQILSSPTLTALHSAYKIQSALDSISLVTMFELRDLSYEEYLERFEFIHRRMVQYVGKYAVLIVVTHLLIVEHYSRHKLLAARIPEPAKWPDQGEALAIDFESKTAFVI